MVVSTIQRLYFVSKPFSTRFKSRKSAWQTTLIIVAIALILNLWVPFVFSVRKMKNKNDINDQYCDVYKNYASVYFIINILYITIIMMLPMIILIVCNIRIIIQMFKSDSNRKKLQQKKNSVKESVEMTTLKKSSLLHSQNISERNTILKINNLSSINYQNSSKIMNSSSQNSTIKVKPHYWTVKQLASRRKCTKIKSSKNLTIILLVISFSFIVFNFPYFIGWLMFYYQIVFNRIDSLNKNYLFAFLQIAENLYVLSYGSKFFIIYASGEFFRNKLHLVLGKKDKNEFERSRITFYTENYKSRKCL